LGGTSPSQTPPLSQSLPPSLACIAGSCRGIREDQGRGGRWDLEANPPRAGYAGSLFPRQEGLILRLKVMLNGTSAVMSVQIIKSQMVP